MQLSQPEGYLAVPASGEGPGVLVLHAWWGLNATMKEVCDRLAGEGFVAYAPDLFHGRIASTIEEAEALVNQVEQDTGSVIAGTAEAVDYLWGRVQAHDRGLGVIAFSFGAYYALQLSGKDPERVRAVTLFYGTGEGEFDRARAAYMGHFADTDPFEPAENVDWLENALKSSGRPVTFYRYEGVGHWFFEQDRPDAFDEPSARLAWERTVAFLRETLSPSPADLSAA
jgi:carboxymethylenebutenolidase